MENPEAVASAIFSLVYAPQTPQEVQAVMENLDYFRRLGDTNGIIICVAQLAHPDRCRLPLESEQAGQPGPDEAAFWDEAAPVPDTPPTDDEGETLHVADANDMLRAWQEAQEEYEPNPYDGTYSEA